MKFSQIFGNEAIKDNLKAMADSGKLGHALLFVEEEGMGALALALAMSQYIVCKGDKKGDACGECSSCHKAQKLIHPDIHFSFPVNAASHLTDSEKIERWKDLIQRNPYFSEQELYKALEIEDKAGIINVAEAKRIINVLSLKPYEANCKVMIIHLAEKMNSEAANKLLKLLEEPPAGTYFMLVTKQPSKMLPTILSRCQIIRLQPEETSVLASRLAQEKAVDIADAETFAHISGGSYGKAVQLAEESLEGGEYEQLARNLFETCLSRDLRSILANAETLAELGRESQKAFCLQAELFLRKLFMFANDAQNVSLAKKKDYDYLLSLSQRIKPDFYEKGLKIFDSALLAIDSNVNAKLIFIDMCNRLYMLL